MTKPLVTLADIQAAAARIFQPDCIHETPLLEVPALAKAAGFKSVLIKNETVHPIGAFKLRGAYNHFLQMTDAEKQQGVFAISSGNHAQAVAYVARQFQVAATVLMPKDAPQLKVENARGYGAEVITFDQASEDRDVLGKQITETRNLHFIHPYNDPRTIAGQGTAGIEIHRQTSERGITPDAIIIPCGGGGFAAGVAVTRDLYKIPPAIFTAEPEALDDMFRSLKTGFGARNPEKAHSICDALRAPTPGSNTLPILMQHGARGLTASDEEIAAAAFLAAAFVKPKFGLRLEPSGASALACALARRGELEGQNVVIIASGANTDAKIYSDMLLRGGAAAARMLPKLQW